MQVRKTGLVLGALGAVLFCVTAIADNSQSGKCLPFFDYSKDKVVSNVVQDGALQKGEVDITPEPLSSNALSEAILKACGAFGSHPSADSIRKIFDEFSPDLMKDLLREVPKFTDAQLRSLLAKIWTSTNGFEHIFCGQPNKDKVGGLHYAARYFELQEKGALCRLDQNVVNEEVLPDSVYTIGVTTSSGVVDRKKGYAIRQTAEDLIFEASRVYLRSCQAPSKQRRVCHSMFHKDGSFASRFVCAPGKGLITFYPLAVVPKDSAECR